MGKLKGRGEKEKLSLLHKQEREHNHWVALTGWGSVKGAG